MKEISPTSRAFTTTPYPAVLAELGRAPTPTGALPHWSNRKTVPARRGWVELPKLSRSRMLYASDGGELCWYWPGGNSALLKRTSRAVQACLYRLSGTTLASSGRRASKLLERSTYRAARLEK